MSGKNFRAAAVLAFGVWLAGLPGVASAQPGQANTRGGTCGPGKDCTVRRLTTVVTSGGVHACESVSPSGPSWGRLVTASAESVYSYSGALCTGSPVERYGFGVTGIGLYSTGRVTALAGYAASLPFASFPTCDAGTKGVQIYDATNNVWKFCNGSSWVAHGAGLVTPGPTNGGWTAISNYTAAAASEDVNFLGPFSPSGATVNMGRLSCSWATAGTGGTNGVFVSVVAIGGGTVCSCNIGSCTQAAREPVDCSCTGPMDASKIYVMRLTGSTDCTTNPQNITCNATLIP